MSQVNHSSIFRKLLFFILLLAQFSCSQETSKLNVLVFSKTEGFRHESIEPGKVAFEKMAQEKGFQITLSEDATIFNEKELKKYHVVMFLNTTGDILNPEQQATFERFIQAGGGYVGIHSASDTEYDWPWYGKLVGAYFLDHPNDPSNVQKATFRVTKKDHSTTQGMPEEFERTDEYYNFRDISPDINVVLVVDEDTYKGGKNGKDHPMSWYQEFDGGRAFYTAMGHTNESFSEPLFLDHVWAGITYAAGGDTPTPVNFAKARPEENRFTKVVLEDNLDEPMELTVLDEERVLFIQRKGEVRLFNTKTNKLKTIATIPVSTKYKNKEGKEKEAEDGLLGLNKDPNFAENNWIYLYYSDPDASRNILTRYELKGEELILDSKKVILEVPVQREECCHAAGSIAWDSNGNLYLSTGDNTNPHASNGYSASDEREGRGPWDAQKSSANTNDLRGKIIRIKPNPDGTYTIPEGNLFPEGTANTRPEIYTMGHRNPFRISIDPKTGFLYWGDVGPDARDDGENRGPRGHDEVGQARKAGNYGWPHFVGDNKAYYKYDFATETSGEKWNPAKPVNNSPNNTGLKELPPAQKAFIWYPYANSEEFPLMGTGGRNAMAGPVFYSEDFKDAERAFPEYYDGKLFIYEWMRGWMMAVTMDEEGNYQSMEPFMPNYKFSNPMDMEFAANGDLYMLEYGSGWFRANEDARLVRIEYNGGNRKPKIQMAANQQGGAVPLALNLNSEGTKDADYDDLSFEWEITSDNGFKETIQGEDAELTLNKPGIYQATLTVTDAQGGVSSESMEIMAGNEPPSVDLEIANGNKSFYFINNTFDYEVKVKDKEDGSLADGKILAEQVSVKIDYLPEGYDKIEIAQGHRSADESTQFARGLKLMEGSDCKACHKTQEKSIGPNYFAIAKKYEDDDNAVDYLSKKIINGGSGVWGEVAMAGHPQLKPEEAESMAKYILSLAKEKTVIPSLPTKGSYTTALPENDKGKGVFIFRASYQDQGNGDIPSLFSEQTYVLRNAQMSPHAYDMYSKDMSKVSFEGQELAIAGKSGVYMALEQVDLSGLKHCDFVVISPAAEPVPTAGGKIEVRLGAPDGKLIGESTLIKPTPDLTPQPIRVELAPTEGFQDIYVVCKNSEAMEGMPLFIIAATIFSMGDNNLQANNQ